MKESIYRTHFLIEKDIDLTELTTSGSELTFLTPSSKIYNATLSIIEAASAGVKISLGTTESADILFKDIDATKVGDTTTSASAYTPLDKPVKITIKASSVPTQGKARLKVLCFTSFAELVEA